jgi:hypothetical protein
MRENFIFDCMRLKANDPAIPVLTEIDECFFSLQEEEEEELEDGDVRLFMEALAMNQGLESLVLSSFGGLVPLEFAPELWSKLADFVKRSSSLQKLKLDDVACHQANLVRSIAETPFLSELTLSRMGVGHDEAQNIHQVLSQCHTLKSLSLLQIDMERDEASAVIAKGLAENKSVQVVALFQVYHCDRIVGGLVDHASLKQLTVENCVESGETMKTLLTSSTPLERLIIAELESPHTRHASMNVNNRSSTMEKGSQDHDPWLAYG